MKKYEILIDEAGYITGLIQSDKGIEIDIKNIMLDYLSCYKLADNKVVIDSEKYEQEKTERNTNERITILEKNLSDTDYVQDGLISSLLQLKNPVTFITDLIALLSSTLTEYPTIIAQRAEWIAELKQLKK